MRIAYFGDQRIDISEYDTYLDMCRDSGSELILTCAEGHHVIAKRGDKKAHHFAHKANVACSCSDNKGPWHCAWQDRVCKDAQEVRLRDDKTLHIADTLIPRDRISSEFAHVLNDKKGYVIEYQHSPMNVKTMRERERFYTSQGYRLIWIFDTSVWEVQILRRYKIQDDEMISMRRKRGAEFPMDGAFTGDVIKIYDFNKEHLFMVTQQSGTTVTGRSIHIEDFDRIYLGSCILPDADIRPFHHSL